VVDTPAIRISDLHKRYGSLQALDGVDLCVEQGEIFGLLGPNGAGKTTLISIVAGLVRPDLGEVSVMGSDVAKDYRAARRHLGVVPQELVFDPFFTVRETLIFQSGYFGIRNNERWISEILHYLDLETKADANMRSLSGGMKRRVLVAQALVHRPQVIVLDEPTAGVDVELRKSLWEFVKRLNRDGHTIVLTTHYLEEAESLCGRIAMMKSGRVVALDSTRNLLRDFSGLTLRIGMRGARSIEAGMFPNFVMEDDRFVFRLNGFNEVEPLLASIRTQGLQIFDLELQPPDLDEVFMRLMARH